MNQLCEYLNRLLTKYNIASYQDEHEPKRFEPTDGEEFISIDAVNSVCIMLVGIKDMEKTVV
jgi:hypothetical protein